MRRLAAAAGSAASLLLLVRRPRSAFAPAAAVALTYWSVVSHARLAARQYRQNRDNPARRASLAALAATFEAIRESTMFSAGDIGVQAFVVEELPWVWRAKLRRLGVIRLAVLPSRSGVQWTRGKGVIGKALERRGVVLCDLESLYSHYQTPQDWASAPDGVRMKLSWTDVQGLRVRYAGVVAVPFSSRRKKEGVVTLDVLVGANFRMFLGDDEQVSAVVRLLEEAATVIAVALDGSR